MPSHRNKAVSVRRPFDCKTCLFQAKNLEFLVKCPSQFTQCEIVSRERSKDALLRVCFFLRALYRFSSVFIPSVFVGVSTPSHIEKSAPLCAVTAPCFLCCYLHMKPCLVTLKLQILGLSPSLNLCLQSFAPRTRSWRIEHGV